MSHRTLIPLALLAALAAGRAHAAPSMLVPPDSAHRVALRRYLDEPGARLVTRFGPVEYFSASPGPAGLECRLPTDPRFGPTSEAHFGWRDLECMQSYTPPEFGRGWRIGSIVGYAAGLVVVAANMNRDSFAAVLLSPFVLPIAALPFGAAGGLVGGAVTRLDDGWHTTLRFVHDAPPLKEPAR